MKDSNQDVNEKLYEMSRSKYFGGGSGRGRGGSNYRGGMFQCRHNSFQNCDIHLGFDRRGGNSGNRGGSGYNNNNGNPRPSRFSNKRSRSRSPPARQSRFDNNSNDNKRPRTDNSHPPNVSLYSIFFSSDYKF